jgi:glutathione S-transferase
MGKPKLGYWNLRGLAQSIRFALEYMGVDYDEVIYMDKEGDDTWINEKPTLGMDCPNLPYWIDDDEKLSESKAILKYVIRKYKPSLLPTDISQLVQVEQADGILDDICRFFAMSVYMDTEAVNSMFDKMVPIKMAGLSKMLGNKKFFNGDEPGYVDFLAYETFYRLKTYRTKFIEGHPNLLALVDNFEKLPKIAAYLESSRYVKTPCYGRMAAKPI